MLTIKKIKQYVNRTNGQAAIIVALLVISFVGMTALVVDMGSLYEDRRTLQGVADAAALAGAQELPDTNASTQAALASISSNYPDDANVSSTIVFHAFGGVDDTMIVVTVSNPDSPIRLGSVYGLSSKNVGASATAVIGSPAGYPVVPWGLLEGTYTPGGEYTLKYGAPPEPAPGNFGALGIDGPGANTYEDCIVYGCETLIRIGDWIDVKTGNMAGPTRDGVRDRVALKPDGIWSDDSYLFTEDYDLKNGDSQFIIVPIISPWPHGHSDQVQILDFKPFVITGYSGHGGQAEVIGTFLSTALIITDGAISGLDETGIKIIRLIE